MDLVGREIRVRAGEPLNIDVPISGGPPPTVSWTKDGKPLLEGGRVEMTNDEDNAKVHIPSCRRDDSGDFQIHLKNDNGEDVGDIRVIVLGELFPYSDMF